jgi:hypothetical protein
VTSEPGAAVPSIRPDGILSRIAGVIRRPRATLTAVASLPGWMGMLVVLTAAAAGSRVAVMETQVGRVALVDEWERTALAFGQDVDDARYAELRRLSTYAPAYALGAALLNGPVLILAVAVGVYVIFGLGAARPVPFGTVWAVVVCTSVPLALRQIVAAVTTYVGESSANATSIGAWFSTLNEASAAARFVGALDLFVIWWVVVLAIGVGVLYQRNARRLALTFLGAYAGLALALAGTMAALGGTA